MATKILKSKKPPPSSSSSSSHLAMIELKQRILTSLSKLSDRDTHQIAAEDLENIIKSLTPEGTTMLLNSLYDATGDTHKPAVKKEAIRLLCFFCATHIGTHHLGKIIAHIVKRVRDSDSGVKDACREAIGELSSLYLKGEGVESVVVVFLKPLFEALNDQSKGVQAAAAMCMARMVQMASQPPPISAFHKLCTRICKYLSNPNFLAKAALLQLVSSLSQVGAISPQGLEPLLQSIHECLTNSDWATRKAAADALSALALHSTNLITGPTITALEACRFDKIKPARDSIVEALQQWQNLAGGTEDKKPPGQA
ncbi:putative MT-associated protein TORTIFOLIA1/SPIRAL2 [Helianthus annuus]|uniref:MT-associated protein TORTIFOLIA1/SPIRAL2 n=1 Tax=Helianthus annuus TaxID=4232 RepID=A0A251U3Q0_HELAN|nr:putative MT-associated protein TORTIFOLIA1/SPIRAL2 [Helianthus annuus]KAJ0833293.1 putative MT-associated protein TORTIFOLIA1/SPIRAL2 [Helianthus annuus]